MTTRKKLILGLCIAFLVVAGSLCSIIIYYYTHPPAVKSLLEEYISRSTRTSVSIGTLSYSLKPFRLQATGVVLEPRENAGGLHLEIPKLTAVMVLEGPLSRRSLVVKDLRIGGFSLHVTGQMHLPRFSRTAGKPPLLTRLLKRLTAVIFFSDVKFQEVAVTAADITAELKDQTIKVSGLQASLNTDRLIEISCSADINWPAHKMNFSAPNLKVTADRVVSFSDPEIACLMTISEAVFLSQQAKATDLEITARLNYRHSSRELLFASAHLAVEELTLRQQSGNESIPVNLQLLATGRYGLKDNQLHVSGFELTMPSKAELSGSLQAQFAPLVRIALELKESDIFPQRLMQFLPDKIQQRLRLATVSGAVGLQGKINGLRAANQWSWHCDLQGRLADNFLSFQVDEMTLKTRISGQIGAVGMFPLLRLSVAMKTAETSFSGESLETQPFKASLSLSGNYPVFLIDHLAADIPRVDMTAGKHHIPINDIEIRVQRGKLLVEKKALFLPEIRFTSSLVKNLLLSLQANGKGLDIAVQGEQVNLIGSALDLNLVPSGWQLDGRDSIQLHLVRKDQGDVSLAGKLHFREVRFQNKDGSYLGEGVSLDTELHGKYRRASSSVTATGSLKAQGGEMLLGRFYGDLKTNAFFSTAEARYDMHSRYLELTGLNIDWQDILALNIHGKLLHKDKTRRAHFSLDIPKTPVRPLVQQFLVEPFKTSMPSLIILKTGGVASANIDFKRSGKQLSVAGHLRWQDGQCSLDDQTISLEGIDLDLPIWYQSELGEESATPLRGALSIQSMVFPLIERQPLAVKLETEPNHLFLKQPTSISVPGGQIHIGPLVCRDIFGPRPIIETSLTTDALDIRPLLGRIWPQPPEGAISVRLDPVVVAGDSIESNGDLRLRAFSGEIILSHLGMSGLFTPAPLTTLSVELEGLNLGSLTTGTSFGKIEGVLRGHIHNLQIANGQPQKFDLLLESIKTRGTPQMISVRAVNNIAQIGGAQSPFMGFAKLFTTFMQRFPYRKIGVHATLKNDIFRINGTIKENGKEYLVRRSALGGVDVINQSTDNRASFRDMIKRITRITEGSRGPVVQ